MHTLRSKVSVAALIQGSNRFNFALLPLYRISAIFFFIDFFVVTEWYYYYVPGLPLTVVIDFSSRQCGRQPLLVSKSKLIFPRAKAMLSY